MGSHPLEVTTDRLGMAGGEELSWFTGDGIGESWNTEENKRKEGDEMKREAGGADGDDGFTRRAHLDQVLESKATCRR